MKSIAQKLMAVISAVVLMTTLLIPAFQASAASVKLNKTKIVIAVGQTYALKLRGTNKTVKWSTSSKKVATVTKKGVVKGVRKGTATITAKVGKKTYKCRVTVEAPKLSATKKTVTAGTSFALKLNGTKRTVKWYTGNKKIATVNQKGVVKTLKAGKVKITAKVGGKSYVCTVTVNAKKPAATTSTAKIATQYNTLINNLKKESSVTVKKNTTLDMKLVDYPAILKTLMGSDFDDLANGMKESGSETLKFTAGKADIGNGKTTTLGEYIPPENRAASLKAEYIKSATSAKTANGGTKLTIVLKSETSKYDGKKFASTPANASVAESFNNFDLGSDGIDGMDMKLVLSGTTIEAVSNANGKLISLKIKTPMKIDMTYLIITLGMGGYSEQTLTITY